MSPLQIMQHKMSALAKFLNPKSGAGGDGDMGGGVLLGKSRLTAHTIELLLRSEPFMRTAMEIMGEDVIRAWRTFPKEKGEVSSYHKLEADLDFKKTLLRALYWTDAFGGALIVPRYDKESVGLEDMAGEFDPDEVEGELLGWKVYAPHHLKPWAPNGAREVPVQAVNGLPETYEVKTSDGTQEIKIHHSWTIPMFGLMSSETPKMSGNSCHGMFGESRADLIFTHMSRAVGGLQNMAHLLEKSNIDVLKVAGLAAALAECTTTEEIRKTVSQVLQRAEASVQVASNKQPMVLDESESLDREGLSTGADAAVKMTDTLVNAYVSATRLPRTKLMGEQAKGLNNGGEVDLTHYYNRVEGIREDRCTRVLNSMDEIVSSSLGQEAPPWQFGSLTSVTPKDKAEIEAKRAQRDKHYADIDLPFARTKIATELDRAGVYDFTDQELADIKASDGPIDEPEGE